ncbi:MAG: FAD-binding protein [Rhodobacteraceae bacterium]|nr:FAD-binding protein [Paracoccaceae bacterium]
MSLPRLRPATEAELAEIVATAAARGQRLCIAGGGTRAGLGSPVTADAVLETGALNGIKLYEPAALTLVAGAGTRLSEIAQTLAAEGQRLPFEPMDHRSLYGTEGEPTLGGMVATNASGPRRIQAGACRDSLIGLRFVDGRGRVIANGGRVMKNVTGYDLVKLMAGSHGTLGVLTEVAFKLLPLPETTVTLILHGLNEVAGVAALTAALGSPYDVSGAAYAGARTLVRIEGFAASVAHRASALAALLRPHAAAEVLNDTSEAAEIWSAIADLRSLAARPGPIWRVSLRPSDGPRFLSALRRHGVEVTEAVLDWGGGLVSLRVSAGSEADGAAIRTEATAMSGHATLLRAPDDLRAQLGAFHPEPAPVAALSAGLRARFDPCGVFNPGRMAPARLTVPITAEV